MSTPNILLTLRTMGSLVTISSTPNFRLSSCLGEGLGAVKVTWVAKVSVRMKGTLIKLANVDVQIMLKQLSGKA